MIGFGNPHFVNQSTHPIPPSFEVKMNANLTLTSAPENFGVVFEISVPTVNPAAAYLASLGNDLSRAAMRYSLNRAAMIAAPELTGPDAWIRLPWEKITAPIVRAIMSKIAGSPSTRNKMLAALKGVARAAWELRLLDTDELTRIRSVKGDMGTRELAGRFVPLGEISGLLGACAADRSPAGARDAAMIALATATGARRAEVASIKAENVREAEAGRFEIRIIGKRNKERTLYVTGGAARALTDWFAIRVAPGCNFTGPLFCSIRKGGTLLPEEDLSTTALDKLLRKRCKQANVTDLNWHDLRRTTTSNLLDAGADIATVAGILGHANVQTTARYDRRGERAKVRASELISVPYFGRE